MTEDNKLYAFVEFITLIWILPSSVVSTVIDPPPPSAVSIPVIFTMVLFKILMGSLKKSSKVFKILFFIKIFHIHSIKKATFFV